MCVCGERQQKNPRKSWEAARRRGPCVESESKMSHELSKMDSPPTPKRKVKLFSYGFCTGSFEPYPADCLLQDIRALHTREVKLAGMGQETG